ncbi:hypothetical protein CVU75_01760 [Candidatus Dependentiae bacterium HGW-Dependentiae-1]|nr:MAG: hypothetical protein CVU75_01760 [Candidatus Dependentiae bacterium HGW-Dependentiae-1]
MKKTIGIHVRLCPSLDTAAQKAIRLGQSLFQCFFMQQETGSPLRPTTHEINTFIREYRPFFSQLFLHGSYLINLSGARNEHHVLKRELALAKRLFFTHMILHPGSAKGLGTKEAGIDQLAREINGLIKRERDIVFVLENIAQAGLSIGGDLHDFKQLLEKIERPEQLAFCIDTAHAHSYGYDLVTVQGRELFVDLVAHVIGWDRVVLVHVNDTHQVCGVHIDQHCVLGEGVLGTASLREFVCLPELSHKPLLLELPELPEEQELALLTVVRGWEFTGPLVPREKEVTRSC